MTDLHEQRVCRNVRTMKCFFWFGLMLCALLGRLVGAAEQSPIYELLNGGWYNGETFEEKTVYVVGDKLSLTRPDSDSEVIDLTGGYVVPAFGEAHSHRPANPNRTSQDNQWFLDDGIFYVMNHGSLAKFNERISEQLVIEGTIDVIFSNAIVSSSQSHSVELWQRLIGRGAFPDTELNELDGEAYFIIESAADLRRRWPEIMATNPDFLKIMLQYSEEYELRRDNRQYFGHSGLNPALIPDIVDRAHQAGLRVSAHIESTADFRVAVAAGVDIIAHLPGYDMAVDDDIESYRLSPDDAYLAAQKDTVVLTTTLLSLDRSEDQPDKLNRMIANHRENLRLLSEAGVKIGVGSDQFSKHSADELMNLASLDLFDNITLLNMISIVTPRAIFPDRNISNFVDGADASFLVLDGNPLDDITRIRSIKMRVKNGVFLGSE